MAFYVDSGNSFGPTGNMKRREAFDLIQLMRSHRRHRWPAFWWRVYPANIAAVRRRRLRRAVKPVN